MKKKYIIKRSENIRKILNHGKFKISSCFVIYFMNTYSLLEKEQVMNKVAFLVSKKLGNAAKRNMIKRRLRISISLYWKKLKKGNYIIFLAKKNILNIHQKKLDDEVKSVLKKIKILDINIE